MKSSDPSMQMQSAPASTSFFWRSRAFLYSAVATAIVTVVIAASAAVSFLRQQAELRAEFITQNFARSMDLTIEGVIDTIDVALLAAVDEIAREISTGKPDVHSITRFLTRQTERVPIVSYFRASNERGGIIYGPGILSPATNNADRDYFIRLRDDPTAGLLVVKPVVGRISKQWVWSFARRINKPDGSFGGMVFAAILTDQIDELLSQIKLGEADSIALRDADQALIARYPAAESISIPIGDTRLSTPFKDALKANPQEGTYVSGATAIDGISRMHSYRRNAKYGFTVNVGIAVEESLAKWHKQVWFLSGLAAAFILASLLFTLLISRAWRRQEHSIAALEASELRSHAIVEASPVPHAINDAQGNITYLNASFINTFGYTPEDIRTLEEWWPKAYPDPVYRQWVATAWQEHLEQARRENTTFAPLEVDIRCKDGSVKSTLVGATPIGAASERIQLVTLYDITARIHAEAALLEHESRYRGIVDATIDGFWVLDSAGRILEVNDRYLARSGYGRQDLIGRTVFKIDALQSFAEINSSLAKSGHQGTRVFETVHRTSDGDLWPVEISTIYRTDEGGRYYSFLRDITERKRLEEARLQSQKMESLGTLAGGIAHDFNNIIATILGNVELARQDASASPGALESLEEIRKAGARARDLVRQILAFSRREPIERKQIDLVPIVEESARLLRSTLPARMALELHCDADLPEVLADATQIEQVLINLATNSMQAMRGDPGRITISADTVMLDGTLVGMHPTLGAMQLKHPGRTLRLVVHDDGPGMDPATLERIFEPFFTTKPPGEGTGLGLSVVHGIVQAHHGAIVAQSAPGEGTTFAIYLPLADAQAAAGPTAPREDAANAERIAPEPNLAGGQHILYLDDDEALVFLVRRLLERRGFRVSGYIDQSEALAALRARPQLFDLVLSDYNMPGMSGLDVAREVRDIRADLPVAIASGFIDEALRAEAGRAGVCELVFKADAVEDFCAVVQRLAQTVIGTSKSA